MATQANGSKTQGTVSAWFTVHTPDADWIPDGEVGFEEVSGLTSEMEVITTKQGNDLWEDKIPGRTKAGQITLKKAMDRNNRIERWHAAYFENAALPDESVRADAIITMYSRRGAPGTMTPAADAVIVRQWRCMRCWPSKIENSSLMGLSNELATVTATLEMYGPPMLVYPPPNP